MANLSVNWVRWITSSVCVISIVLQGRSSQNVLKGPQEYCERESFDASCGEDEVIIMSTALYGRMRLGHCVRKNYGSLGCSTDVLPEMDKRCSGRKLCNFPLTALQDTHKPCPSDLMSYLEASYKCLKVTSCAAHSCQASDYLKLPASEGYVASEVTAGTGCGSAQCPWVVQADPGQRVNLTVFYFSNPTEGSLGSGGLPAPRLCHRFATVNDRGLVKDLVSCGSEPRIRHVYTSVSSAVELKIHTGGAGLGSPGHFVLRYEVVGCPNPKPPYNGWVSRSGDTAVVRCNGTDTSWTLTCKNYLWQGHHGTCGAAPASDGQEPWSLDRLLEGDANSSQGMLIMIGIGVALGVAIGFIMLAIAILFIKRKNRRNHIPETTDSNLEMSPQKDYPQSPNPYPGSYSYLAKDGGNKFTYPGESGHYGTGYDPHMGVPYPDVPPPRQPSLASTDQFNYNQQFNTGTGMTSPSMVDPKQNRDHIYESPKFSRKGLPGEKQDTL